MNRPGARKRRAKGWRKKGRERRRTEAAERQARYDAKKEAA